MLNTIQFDMDDYARDDQSKRGLEGLEYRTRVPLGHFDRDRFGGELAGYSRPADSSGERGIVVPGFATRSTLRHEAGHTAQGDNPKYPEVGQRIRDAHYAKQQGDPEVTQQTARWFRRMKEQQPDGLAKARQHYRDNPIQFERPPEQERYYTRAGDN